ncbi:papain-like cysteine protease family protein [Dyella choica]|uniref:Uncharacterized protein n=1 Tax=Dyella choica TaxID=1927959 RepID=A0A3S0PQC0_9GAMM|nr:papain-like cysteine protease family protein [Dyella choica]RUL78249.1 hypothetical protein EKH80_05290 [Dyella choica]
MLTLQRDFKYEGDARQAIFTSLRVKFNYPVFNYVADPNGAAVMRTNGVEKTLAIACELTDTNYRADLPPRDLMGENPASFVNYLQQAFANTNFNVEDIAFNVDVLYSDVVSNIPVGGTTFGCLYFPKTAAAAPTNGLVTATALPQPALPIANLLFAGNVSLINRAPYEQLFEDYRKLTSSQDEFGFANLLRQFVVLADDRTHELPTLNEAVLARLTTILTERGVTKTKEAIALVQERFAQLFNFGIQVKEIKPLAVAGRFTIKPKDNQPVTHDDVQLYDITVSYAVLSENDATSFASSRVDWASNPNKLENNAIAFTFDDKHPIVASAVHGSLTISVKAFDGSVVWSKGYRPDDPALQKLDIVVALQRPGTLSTADGKQVAVSQKLRGKLILVHAGTSLKDAMVLVQAKKKGDTTWRIVSAGAADSAGNFTIPYPVGNYVAAQALVSLTPNSPVDIPVTPGDPDGHSISDDFLYLLVDLPLPPPVEEEKEGTCDCRSTEIVPRLPDHNDLIHSDAFSQDVGGSCVSLSTPHRTLREFNYQAIVRTSDPDVANYTLIKRNDGSFDLTGGSTKVQRGPVDLHNPVKWQDAPDYHSNLSLYQAVTVATGHILHYKAEFRADGYSLGDMLYSLPLAPGQKKQIVIFDAAHSLQGSESQALSQGERLAANLTDDRGITDQIAGNLGESLQGSSDATTSGVSAGLGAAGSAGFFGASLGVAGGYANANSSAQQNSARNVGEYFHEKLRQSIMQNASSYRQQNASVVTRVQEGQHYSAETEVVANHNHCHAVTMAYFEVLRHYAIFQELTDAEECVFVPLLMTHFTPDNISKWRDVLARYLLPLHGDTYLQPYRTLRMGRAHPLLGAFDANDRIRTNYANVDFPASSYDDEVISNIQGELTMRVNLPRPKTRYDRIKSLPIITKTVTTQEVDPASAAMSAVAALFTFGLSLAAGDDGTHTVTQQVMARAQLFDAFMQMDANYQSVPPAQCVRITNFRPFQIKIFGSDQTFTPFNFFQESILDRQAWTAYANILGYTDVLDFLDYYFKDRLIAEWDGIFYQDIVPYVFQRLVDSLHLDSVATEWTSSQRYKGGERVMRLDMNGSTSLKRNQFNPKLKLSCGDTHLKSITDQLTLIVENVRLTYSTPHFNGVLFSGHSGMDLFPEVELYAPESANEKRNPRKEDAYVVQRLIEHLNSNVEHYNKALWFNLDGDRRFALLDGFNIQIYDDFGEAVGYRSLASVVKNQLISIAGNSLVFPVAAGYKVSKSYIVERNADGNAEDVSLLDHYAPLEPTPPYRVSIPSRGVYVESVKGQCDACEDEEDNTSQDWTKFTTDEPTQISPLTPPVPTVTDWKAAYKDFAPPIVNIQNAPATPAPGVGLAGITDLLGKSGIFKDVTGLDANQQNAIKTLQSNNENVRALADSAKGLAMQQHNTDNSDKIINSLKKAKDSGGITQQEYGGLLKNHFQQVIDGGESQKLQAAQAKPSLTDAAIDAANQGKGIKAQKTTPEGGTESVEIEGGSGENVLAQVNGNIPVLQQANDMACWATVATMMVNWKNGQNQTVPQVLAIAGTQYVNKFNNSQGLMASEKQGFISALGMTGEAPASYTLQQYITWMQTYGPLWVTTDSALDAGPFSPHARILTKITGSGTPDGVGTNFTFIDPATGSTTSSSFGDFINAYEQMVTDNPSDNLFVQIVHFTDNVSAGGSSSTSGGEGASEGGTVDTDPRREQVEVARQLSVFSGAPAGSVRKMFADYVTKKMAQVWNGSGGIICFADYKDQSRQVDYLNSNLVPAGYAAAAAKARDAITEAFDEWDNISAGKPDPLTWADPGTWAYTRSFVVNNQRFCAIRCFPLVKPNYAKDYFPVLAHEVCHYLLSFSEDAVLADTRAYLFDPSITAAADLTLGATARNALIQEVVGRRLNYLAHLEIDTATPVADASTGANIGKKVFEWAKGPFAANTYYGPITQFLTKLPSDAARRNQVGIWLQNFYTSVDMYDDSGFTTKLKNDLNMAGEFLKKATQADYDAQAPDGIH